MADFSDESVKGSRNLAQDNTLETPPPDTAAKPEASTFLIPLFINSPHPAPVKDFMDKARAENDRVRVIEIVTGSDLASKLQSEGGGILLFSAQMPAQIGGLVEFLRSTRGMINLGLLNVVVIGDSRNRTFVDRLTKIGVSEVLPLDVPAKVLAFKMKKIIDKVYNRAKTRFDKLNSRGKAEGKTEGGSRKATEARAQDRSATLEISFKPSMPIPCDCWLTASGGAVRVMGRIRVKLSGPADILGEWKPLPVDKGPKTKPKNEHDSFWEWVPHEKYKAEFPLGLGVGCWVFEGDKPDMRGRIWSFAGQNPELTYWVGAQGMGKKFWIEGASKLAVAQDPADAERIAGLIDKSINLATKIKAESLRSKGQSKEAEELEEKATRDKTKEAEKKIKGFSPEDEIVEAEAESMGSEFAESVSQRKRRDVSAADESKSSLPKSEETAETHSESRSKKKRNSDASGESESDSENDLSVERTDGNLSDIQLAKGGKQNPQSEGAARIAKDRESSRAWGGDIKSDQKQSKDLSGRFGADRARDINDQRGEDPVRQAPKIKSKMAEEAEKSERAAPIADVKLAMEHVRKNLSVADTFRKARERKAAQKPHVPGQVYEPLFKPLSLALLFAEVISSQRIEAGDRASRCARLLTESVDGSLFEFWVKDGSRWKCVGSSSGLKDKARGLEFIEMSKLNEPEVLVGAAVVVPLENASAAWVAIGASAADVGPEFWKSIAKITRRFGTLGIPSKVAA